MSITPIVFLGLFFGGILGAVFVSAHYGMYTYLLVFHMSPHHAWWDNLVPDLRYLLVAGVVALATALLRRDPNPGESWFAQPALVFFSLFVAWLWLLNLWVISHLQVEGSVLFTKHLMVAIFIYCLAKDNLDAVKNVCMAVVVGCAWFGWQTMGHRGRVEGAAGAIADANTMGMHTAAGVVLAAMMLLGLKDRYRWVPFLCVPLVLNTVIQSGSRGSFLALVFGGVVAMFFCPPTLSRRFRMLGVLGVVLFSMLAHQQFIDRMVELFEALQHDEKELDGSAASRSEIARAGWAMALDYPMGVGHRGTAILSPLYMDESLLTSGGAVVEGAARAAHNTFMAALVSYGFIGLGLYVSMILWCGAALLRMRTYARRVGDEEVGVLAGGIAAALGVVVAAGMFSNFVYAEILFWMIGLVAALSRLLNRTREQAGATDALAPGEIPPA